MRAQIANLDEPTPQKAELSPKCKSELANAHEHKLACKLRIWARLRSGTQEGAQN